MDTSQKIKTRAELGKLCKEWRQAGNKIGFTSGSFDILHAGHAAYLEKAKTKVDILVVGVNTDSSVRRYKGGNRPIISENDRAMLLASLESVDYVFLFDEARNSRNIDELQPDLYIKAGDYKEGELSSKELVEKSGGEVLIIPIVHEISSTGIIERIARTFGGNPVCSEGESGEIHIPHLHAKASKVVFLDRDGTINKDVEYLHEPDRFEFLHNAREGLLKMQELGFRLVIVTTQAGIGLGYFKKEDFYAVNRRMFKGLAEKGIIIDKIYFCPHSLGDKCDCRKPKTALFRLAGHDLGIDLSHSYIIGDKTSDIEAGKRLGCKTILISSANPDSEYKAAPDYQAADLLAASEYLLNHERRI